MDMFDTLHKGSLKEKVLDAIKRGDVSVRPKWHYILQASLSVTGALILFLAILFLVSFIIFSMRQTGVWFIPSFGFRGIFVMIRALPWLLIALSVIFIGILEILVRHYAFAYRRPLLYSMAGIFLVVVLGSVAVERTTVHRGLFLRSEQHRMPVGGGFYLTYGMHRFNEIHPGTISNLTENGFTISTRRNEVLTIVVTPDTRFPYGTNLGTGDAVVVFGDRDDEEVAAMGIMRVEGENFGPTTELPGTRMHPLIPRRPFRFAPGM